MSKKTSAKKAAKKAAALRQGVSVLIGLAALTAAEYWISFLETANIALFVIALFKSGLIMQYFMHIAHLWSEEEAH